MLLLEAKGLRVSQQYLSSLLANGRYSPSQLSGRSVSNGHAPYNYYVIQSFITKRQMIQRYNSREDTLSVYSDVDRNPKKLSCIVEKLKSVLYIIDESTMIVEKKGIINVLNRCYDRCMY